ncbi:MAG TPA: hypothetical protein VF006_17595 [Longimicrobium sp.]
MTQLSYRLTPPKVFVATATGLTVTISVPTEGQAVTLQDGDEIDIYFPAPGSENALTEVLPTTVTSSRPDRFSAAMSGTGEYYVVTPFGFDGQTLLPGESFDVVFGTFTVVGGTGSSALRVDEFIGSGKQTATLSVERLAQELNVIAWLRDLVVGLGQKTTLSWQSYGGTMVVVAGFDTGPDSRCPPDYRVPRQKCFPVTGEPPHPGYTSVGVPSTTADQWQYTVRVYTSDGQSREQLVSLNQSRAFISGFGVAPGLTKPTAPVGAMQQVPLQWRTLFGTAAYLNTPAGQLREPTNPAVPVPVQPGVDALNGAPSLQQIPDTVQYRLQVQGFGAPAEDTVPFRISPVRLLYYKYMQKDGEGKLSDPRYSIDPSGWKGVQQSLSPQLNVFTLYQPGKFSEVRYLGPGDTTHPQVQYFAATPGEGGTQTLDWVTANVTAMVLNPGAYTVPADQIARGSYVVTPGGTTDYVLEATAAGGEKVTSTLRVTVPA